ncbi:MAG TPA: DNA topoisomerase III [Candidatus Limnocylindria bacterium]|nr:DNA topoisomerase III [Candidatus Limnocylindria bacterium]
MGKTLIIAEKPSVASDIAKALGGFKKTDDYYENDQYVIGSAVGHLLEIAAPEAFEAKKGKWSFAALPVIPPHFDLRPREKSEAKLKTLQKLIKRKDVDKLINACDAGREGELIFRYIIQYTQAKQPIQRLWMQSMTTTAIRDGFAHLRSDAEMLPLAEAATCRSESDWLVGINGTRVMTAFNSKGGGFNKTTVGRVQTPTLAILVEREEKIRRFVARTYWEIHGTFVCEAGVYNGRWFDEKFVKPPGGKDGKESDEGSRAERVWDQAQAEAIRAKCIGKPGIVTEESKSTTQLSGLLYDLTSLQRDANKRFGLSASRTLSVAQALYERHKVLTYPRTDSRALPEDYLGTVRSTLETMSEGRYQAFAQSILKNGWVRPNKRIFNNAKISDHFAIIPTNVAPTGLSEMELKIYDMVVKRFLSVFYPAAEYLVTTRITRVESEPFKTEGKVLMKAGWLEVYGKEAQNESDDGTANLVPVKSNEKVDTKSVELKQAQTKPPARYSEATLLGAMEGAGKLVDDDELREAMAEKGLGTPATRASIIEGLVDEEYLHRQANELLPTGKAFMLLALLRGLSIEELTKPELTGEWEFRLKQMEHGRLSRPEFMAGIADMTRRMVDRTKAFQGDEVPGDFGDLKTPCPKCGGVIKENYRRFQCSKCDFSVPKFLASRLMDASEMEALITHGKFGPLQGFRSRQGFPFAALLKLTPEFKLEFDFGDDKKKDDPNAPPPDFTGKEPVGKCPKCGSNVFENGMNYVCEKAVGAGKTCDFRGSTIILQQPVERAQMAKLLSEGKTEKLSGFVSKKTNRKFEAFLVMKKGAISFEFPPREKKKSAKESAKDEPKVILDFTKLEAVGTCPKCKGKVYDGPASYICERSQAETRPCTFKIGKTILSQPIEKAQAQKLLADGRSDLLTQFVSTKSGKNFSAFLVLANKGKVEFEFPERT